MKVLIIEDEPQSANKLQNYVQRLAPESSILAILKSVRESVAYLRSNKEPDLIFLDVQLTDGESFEIFEQVVCDAFIIFVTAFDLHSLRAFDLNTVSYLLKPFDQSDVAKALDKYYRIGRKTDRSSLSRFVVKKGSNFFTLSASEIAYFIKLEVLYLVTNSGDRFLYDSSLDNLEKSLDSNSFFRISRNSIIHYESIRSFKPYSSHRYQISLSLEKHDELIVSQSRASNFKKWLNKR